ncbi:MAG: phosphodiester glycosidase family protein [Hyphomonadaceae bacterium]
MRAAAYFGLVLWMVGCAAKPVPACQPVTYNGNDYTVCSAKADADIRLFLYRPSGKPLSSFEAVNTGLADEGRELIFAMNAGMYHETRAPVGLYVEEGHEAAAINTRARDGNFGLVPNGVFYVSNGRAGVAETGAFLEAAPEVEYATQSGPMLVIEGTLHPAFNADGTSAKKRNGVGISADGDTVYFVISDGFVNFHSFASLFRDHLQTPNALFLDGTVSRLFHPASERNDPGLPLGPIVGLVAQSP